MICQYMYNLNNHHFQVWWWEECERQYRKVFKREWKVKPIYCMIMENNSWRAIITLIYLKIFSYFKTT